MLAEAPTSIPIDVPEGWELRPLDRLAEPSRGISYGIVQPGQHDADGVPILRVNNVRNGRIDTTDVLRVSSAIESKYERTRLRGGEVLLSLVGTLGECAVVPAELLGWNVARAIAVIPLEPGIDPRWVTYCLRSTAVQQLMRAWATTTVQATLNLRDVRRLPILLAPERLRAAITDVVSSLDDKIEQNRRTSRALERLARATFQAWFVDFEPVKAKQVGATEFPCMPQDIFDALADRLVQSELGPAPAHWEMKPLSKVCTLISGGTPKRSEPSYWDGDVPWYSIKDAPSDGEVWVFDTDECITQNGLENSAAQVVPKGCTIISARGTVGKLAMAGRPMAFNQSCYGLLPVDQVSFSYLNLMMRTVVSDLQQRTHGSVFDTITRATFDGLLVTAPPNELISSFEAVVAPLFDTLLALLLESAKLAEMRDLVLPRLLSGQARAEMRYG